jgi:LysM repeat protein
VKRTSVSIAIVILLLTVALAMVGCTKEKPGGREPDTAAMEGTVVTATVMLLAPTAPIGGDVVPTLMPTVRATTVAVVAAATTDSGFDELIAADVTPTPTPAPPTPVPPTVQATEESPDEATPAATSVPVLTPAPQPTIWLPSATPAAMTPSPAMTPQAGQPGPNNEVAMPPGVAYVVRWGDTLSSISFQFGVTVEAIKSANGITSDIIVVGQQLVIPVATAPSPGPGAGTVIHIVQPGENLFRIALLYNTTVEAITQANSITSPWVIYVGQQLVIPVGPGSSMPLAPDRTYVVQSGDTLYTIAVRFNISVEALMVANNLPNPNTIYVGQVLALP